MPIPSNPFAFLPGQLRLTPGHAADYRQLERFHYARARPASFARVWTLHFCPAAPSCAGERLIAVAVLSYPPLRCAARERVLRLSPPDGRQLAPFVNRHLRTISRVIVHPQFRGIGLASLLIRATCALADTPLVEAIARMGAAHPLFERAGMTRHPTLPGEATYFLYSAGVSTDCEHASRGRLIVHRISGPGRPGPSISSIAKEPFRIPPPASVRTLQSPLPVSWPLPANHYHEYPTLTVPFSWYIIGRMIDRTIDLSIIRHALKRSRVVALLGPRQCGKTTLARQLVPSDSLNYFDLEDPQSLARLSEPGVALRPLKGLVVIDEIQRRPDLFPLLRVLADRKPLPARFLILGSASAELLRQSSETLAGRLETIPLEGFRLADLGASAQTRHWLRGGFPLSYTPRKEADSFAWRKHFLQTFLERDMPQLGIRIPAAALYRFWSMVAHYHGQIWNAAELARAMAVNEPTVRRYLDLMTSVFMVRQLQPWHENLGKRQVKAPKVYIRDSGLLHALLGITNQRDLENHPKVGASWEGYAVEEIIKAVQPDEAYFWATYQGAELDLLLLKNGKRIGVECKRTDAPTFTPSMRLALSDLKLHQLQVVYPGDRAYPLADKVEAIPLSQLVIRK